MDDSVDARFAALVGQELPGGCADCDAYQTVEPDPEFRGMWHWHIHHDDSCPTYRAMGAPR